MVTITKDEFKRLAEYIRSNYGINLKEEKLTLVNGRLKNILELNGFDNFSDYFDYVTTDKTGDAAVSMIDRITTNHTFFMREPDHFFYFRDNVLPYLKAVIKDRDLRVWSAGCSTGEEPYTLAMIIDEFFGDEKKQWDAKVLATDISSRVLDEAKKGIYSNEKIASIPSTWKLKYLNNDKNGKSVDDKIKAEVIYRRFNLMERTYPFKKKFHAIFCRNVMIYFDNQTKRNLVDKLYDSTENGGFLFIGHSESLSCGDMKYKYIMPSVYRKE